MKNLPPCVVCGSTRYRKDVGVLVCSNGHQSNIFREELGDEEAIANQSSRALKLKKTKKSVLIFESLEQQQLKKKLKQQQTGNLFKYEQESSSSSAIKFEEGTEKLVLEGQEDEIKEEEEQDCKYFMPKILRYELFQFHLRECAKSVIESQLAPENEYMHVIKELWLMFINQISNQNRSDNDTEDTHNLCFDIISHENPDERDDGGDPVNISRIRLSPERLPYLLIHELVLSFLYLGLLYLRYPVFLMDIYRWATSGIIPYLDPTHGMPTYLLSMMELSFSQRKKYWFNSKRIPKFATVKLLTSRLSLFYEQKYGFIFPAPIKSLVWDRLLHELRMPDTSKDLIDHLYRIWHGYSVSDIKISEKYQSHTIYELMGSKYIACIIVGIKLIYGLDDSPREIDKVLIKRGFLSFQEWMSLLKEKSETWLTVTQWTETDLLDPSKRQKYIDFWKNYLNRNDYRKYPEANESFERLLNSHTQTSLYQEKINTRSNQFKLKNTFYENYNNSHNFEDPSPITENIETSPSISSFSTRSEDSSHFMDSYRQSEMGYQQHFSTYVFYDYKRDKVGDFHRHYDVFMKFLSSFTGISVNLLQTEVELLERSLIDSFPLPTIH